MLAGFGGLARTNLVLGTRTTGLGPGHGSRWNDVVDGNHHTTQPKRCKDEQVNQMPAKLARLPDHAI